MANNTNLPRNADIAAGGKLINELIPKSMTNIVPNPYVAIIPAPHHHPLRPVSCRRRNDQKIQQPGYRVVSDCADDDNDKRSPPEFRTARAAVKLKDFVACGFQCLSDRKLW